MNDRWRLLYVDNDGRWRKKIRERLEKTGEWTVAECDSAGKVLELLNRGKTFDVAFVDLGLEADLSARVESGAQLARILVDSGIKVGLISGQSTEIAGTIARSLNVPFYDKGEINDVPGMARETLYWGIRSHQEKW